MLRTTLRSLWFYKRRLVSTALAVLLGVAFMSGTLILGDTLDHSIKAVLGEATPGIDAEIRGAVLFDTGFGATRDRVASELVPEVRAVDEVGAAYGYVQTQSGRVLGADGESLGADQGPPTILESIIADPAMSSYEFVEGRVAEADNEMILNRGAAKDGDLHVGDMVTVVTALGAKEFELVGIYDIQGRASILGTVLAGFTPEVAQQFAGITDGYQTIVVHAKSGVSPEELVSALQADLLPANDIDILTGEAAANERADDLSQGLSFFTTFLMIFAVIALTVGAFIIYNTFSILVAQRSKELALMRAIGAARRQVLASVLLEATFIGMFSAGVGLLGGVGLAMLVRKALDALNMELATGGITVTTPTIVTALVAGLAVTFFSALVPARRATRVAPIEAIREIETDSSTTSKLRTILGLAALVLGGISITPAFGESPDDNALLSVGVGALFLLLSLITLGPAIAKPIAQLAGIPLGAARGISGQLASQNAVRSPKRTSSTAAALMIGVALVGFITIFAHSAKFSIDKEINRGLKADLILRSQVFDVGIPLSVTNEVAALTDVADVASMRRTFAQVRTSSGKEFVTFASAINPSDFTQLISTKMYQGSLGDLTRGKIVVDQAAARDNDINVGDTLNLTFPSGSSAKYVVTALGDDPFLLGMFTITHQDWNKNVANATDNIVFIKHTPGASITALQDEIETLIEPYPMVEVKNRDQFMGSIVAQLDSALNILYGLLGLSVFIALIGIANTLALSIHERTRELGLLRAVGMTRSQLRSSIRWEAAIISLIGTVEGLAYALGISFVLIKTLGTQGFSVYAIPTMRLAVIVIIFALLGVIAAIRPARRASKLNILDAIAAE